MKKRCAVVCSRGLGDGLIFLTLSHNLHLNGYEVDTYHSSLSMLQDWFPHLPIKSFPKEKEIPKIFSSYDMIFINSDKTMENICLQRYAKMQKPNNSWILHATTCRGKKLPGDFRFDTDQSMVTNLLNFCQSELHLSCVFRENGLIPLSHLISRKENKRVILHPTSTSEKKNWPANKFIQLATQLKKKQYEPYFMVAPFERKEWEWVQFYEFPLPFFSSLFEMSSFLYESGYFVGIDSGIGHLASSMRIPTLTIFGCKRKEFFWKPDWVPGRTVSPTTFLPNWKGLRLREKYWKPFLSVKKVVKEFDHLVAEKM